jgi:hypothetical protein
LSEHFGLLHALDDQPVLAAHIVEEAGLVSAFRGRRSVEAAGGCPADRAASDGIVGCAGEVVQLDVGIGKR